MTPAERFEAIEAALMRALGLSRAIEFMVTAETEYNATVFCASIEQVNDCVRQAIQVSINHTDKLVQEFKLAQAFRTGGVA